MFLIFIHFVQKYSHKLIAVVSNESYAEPNTRMKLISIYIWYTFEQ